MSIIRRSAMAEGRRWFFLESRRNAPEAGRDVAEQRGAFRLVRGGRHGEIDGKRRGQSGRGLVGHSGSLGRSATPWRRRRSA